MRIGLILALTIFILSCNQKERKKEILSRENIPAQEFEIDPSKDTTLLLKGGTTISILKGTFAENGTVKLTVKEAITVNDIVMGGLTTMSDGKPLQSGGMIFIDGEQNGKQPVILKPIEISIPTKDFNPGMLLFRGEMTRDSQLNWKDPELPLDREENEIVNKGQNLFQSNCQSCHLIEKNSTGPALAFVTQRRCMGWLKKVIRNPMQLAKEDECYRAQDKMYAGKMMAFPTLSDADIEAIFSYIENQSQPLIGDEGTPENYDPCHNLIIKDTIKTQVLPNNIELDTRAEIIDPPIDDTIPPPPVNAALQEQRYIFGIDKFGWFNIDIYAATDPDFVEGKLFATLKGIEVDDEEHVLVYLIVPSKKIFVQGHKNQDGKYYFFYRDNGYISLPQDKTAFILAKETTEENPRFAKFRFTTSTKHDFTIELKPTSDIKKEIAEMRLDSFKFEPTKPRYKTTIIERVYQFVCPDKPRIINESSRSDTMIVAAK